VTPTRSPGGSLTAHRALRVDGQRQRIEDLPGGRDEIFWD
jgi:hypothetical protein